MKRMAEEWFHGGGLGYSKGVLGSGESRGSDPEGDGGFLCAAGVSVLKSPAPAMFEDREALFAEAQ
jgi:hypothetical protein